MNLKINNQTINIRNERPSDYLAVEKMTREAFWNIYAPGCVEHYLVHVMRSHQDFIPELDLVIELNGRVIANVMYTKAKLIDETGREKTILTFGPISVSPEFQRRGYGKVLLEESFKRAKNLGYDTIVIFGIPGNYVSRGFVSCLKHQVMMANKTYPAAMMVKELVPGVLKGHEWIYQESPVMENFTTGDVQEFDQRFEPLKKAWQPSQEEFFIVSHSTVK